MAIDRLGGGSGFDGSDRVRRDSEAVNRTRGDNARAERTGQGADQVDVSPRAREIADLVARARELPEIRKETVEAIRGDLAKGSHQLDTEKLAKLMVEFERELEG